jgi:negative regulator of sigma E activity
MIRRSGLGTSAKIMNANSNSSDSDMDPLHTNENHTRDRFELLSAYLDGEVTAEERCQVEQWLAEDPQVQNMHRRLMMLRQGFKTMPAPIATRPVEQTIENVFEKVDRRSRFRLLTGGAGFAAAAAALVATVVGVHQFNQGSAPQLAAKSNSSAIGKATDPASPEELQVALDEPVLLISKMPTTDPALNQDLNGLGTKNAIDLHNQ